MPHPSDSEELYIPGLTQPSLMTSLPPADPISGLISANLSQEDQQAIKLGNSQRCADRTAKSLFRTHSWRALAVATRTQILDSDPTQTSVLLELWSLRLHSIYRLNLPSHLSREIENVFCAVEQTLSNSSQILEIVPFDILIMRARLPALVDPDSESSILEVVENLLDLVERCKKMLWSKDEQAEKENWKTRAIWTTRLIGTILAGHQTWPSDNPHRGPEHWTPEPFLASEIFEQLDDRDAVDQVWIEVGDLNNRTPSPSSGPSTAILLNAARGEWEIAEANAKAALQLIEREAQLQPPPLDKTVLCNNLAVALLYQGQISKALEVMRQEHQTSVSEPTIFNQATLLELVCSGSGLTQKRERLLRLANQHTLEGVKPEVFKLT